MSRTFGSALRIERLHLEKTQLSSLGSARSVYDLRLGHSRCAQHEVSRTFGSALRIERLHLEKTQLSSLGWTWNVYNQRSHSISIMKPLGMHKRIP